MILAQIEEWFHESLAGIREAGGSTQYRELVIKPRRSGGERLTRYPAQASGAASRLIGAPRRGTTGMLAHAHG
jgi:hypothetical protein